MAEQAAMLWARPGPENSWQGGAQKKLGDQRTETTTQPTSPASEFILQPMAADITVGIRSDSRSLKWRNIHELIGTR
jgi:hypothetical protein